MMKNLVLTLDTNTSKNTTSLILGVRLPNRWTPSFSTHESTSRKSYCIEIKFLVFDIIYERFIF